MHLIDNIDTRTTATERYFLTLSINEGGVKPVMQNSRGESIFASVYAFDKNQSFAVKACIFKWAMAPEQKKPLMADGESAQAPAESTRLADNSDRVSAQPANDGLPM